MPEIDGQRITGTDLSERDLYALSLEYLAKLIVCYRGLALKRGDMRWLMIVQLLDRIMYQTKRLIDMRGKPLVIMEERTGRH